MKKAFAYRLSVVILISMLAIVFLCYHLQIKSAEKSTYQNSAIKINQIAQILEKNDIDITRLNGNLKEDYFIRAKAAAYIIQNNPSVIGDLKELKKIASLLQIDELHLFNREGLLFDGTEPAYYGYTFQSGEQMRFFLPMLNDYSMQLCQDIQPNTAESKPMQYIAVWRQDRKGIIQIGMNPIRLLAATEKNELPYIFSMVTSEESSTIFVIDPETQSILGSTDDTFTGKTANQVGIPVDKTLLISDGGLSTNINGQKSYCVIRQAGNVLVGISTTYDSMYRSMQYNMRLVVISLCILSAIIIILILKLLDQFIIRGIHQVIHSMKTIASGDLDCRVNVDSSPEFLELGHNINHMVLSLLETTGKLSLVFDNVNISIAVYEYNQDMKRVLATQKIGDILMLSEQELHEILSDRTAFHQKLLEICAFPYAQEEDVYLLGVEEPHYIKIKSYQEDRKTLGIIIDVTAEIMEKQQIKQERDVDLLTGLFNRRAFLSEVNQLFASPETLKVAALLVLDMDNLKYTNDNWGHACGDKLLHKAATLLTDCEAPHTLAARIGGDEFVLLIYHEDSQAQVQQYIDRLYETITQSSILVATNETVSVQFSGGYIFYPECTLDYNELFKLADQTMYAVKQNQKGRFAKYEPDS